MIARHFFFCNQLYYPATCRPTGHGSSRAAVTGKQAVVLHDFFPRIPSRSVSPAATHGLSCRPSGAPPSSSPQSVRRNKSKRQTKEHSVWPAPELSAPPFPQPLPKRTRTPFPVFASLSPPLQSPGPPKACLPAPRAPLRPALCVVLKATSAPSLRPRGPLVGARPYK